MTKPIVLTILGLFAVDVGVARAERVDLSIGTGANWTNRQSVDALTDDNSHSVFTLRAAAVLPELILLPGFVTEVELGWDASKAEGLSYQQISGELDTDILTVAGRLRRQLWKRIGAYGRVGMGIAWAELALQDIGGASSTAIRDTDRAFTSMAGAGAELDLSGNPEVLSLLLRFEIGYAAQASFDFRSTPARTSGDELTLDARAVSLGSINTSGPQLRFVLGGRF